MIHSIKRIVHFINGHPIARHHLLGAYFAFLKWQMVSLIPPYPRKVKLLMGLYVWAEKGNRGITGNIYTGLHEFEDMAFLLHFLRGKDSFLDIGGNVGMYSLLAAGITGAETSVYEPVPLTFARLEQNIKLNNLEHLITAHQKGISDAPGMLHFTLNNDTENKVTFDQHKDSRAVDVITLNFASAKKKPILIKIDVEGYEYPVLDGGIDTLNNKDLKAIIIELNGSGEQFGFDEEKIDQILMDHSFKSYSYNAFERKLEEHPRKHVGNTLYVRDYDFVSERLKTAASFTVFGEKI